MPVRRKNFLRPNSDPKREGQGRALIFGAILFLSMALFILVLGLTLPWAAERAIIRSFRLGLQAKVVLADVKAGSAWRLLGGKSESMELMMEFDDTSLLALSALRACWGPSNVALSLMRRGRGGERDAEPTDTELYWNEANLASYLNRVQGEVLVSRVEISEEQVAIYGSVALFGGRHNIYLAGRPKSDDLGRVVFTAREWRVEGPAQTEQLRKSLCEALSFEPNLSPLAWKVWAKQVVLSPGMMLVYGSSSCCH
jgi:hypothetical protein